MILCSRQVVIMQAVQRESDFYCHHVTVEHDLLLSSVEEIRWSSGGWWPFGGVVPVVCDPFL